MIHVHDWGLFPLSMGGHGLDLRQTAGLFGRGEFQNLQPRFIGGVVVSGGVQPGKQVIPFSWQYLTTSGSRLGICQLDDRHNTDLANLFL